MSLITGVVLSRFYCSNTLRYKGFYNRLIIVITLKYIGGSRGVPGAHPLWDPVLSFSHTFSAKSAHAGGPLPTMGARPPTGNPGSATEIYILAWFEIEGMSYCGIIRELHHCLKQFMMD